jgi:hypothetical protein
VSDKVFSLVVDGEDVASFATTEQTRMIDGLLHGDFWKYTQYLSATGDGMAEFRLDRPEILTRMHIWTDEAYYFPKDIELVFDGSTAKRLTLEDRAGRQSFALDGIAATIVALKVLSHYPNPTCEKDLVEIDEIEFLRQVPEDFGRRMVFLAKPGGLVKYPLGRGGIILNQIDYAAQDSEVNRNAKRAIFANLLRNMGASFQVTPAGSGGGR